MFHHGHRRSEMLLTVATVLVATATGATSTGVTDHMRMLARANNDFTVHLYHALLADNPNGSLFFSPLSISTALAMTHMGARGSSAAQMGQVLGFNLLEEALVHRSFRELNALLYGSGNKYTLRSANRLYGKADVDFLPEFVDATQEFYDATFEGVADFVSPDTARRINAWVAERTGGKIRDLIAPGSLDSLTKLILVNAIYFKGSWASRFNPEVTEAGVFKSPREGPVEMHMMHQSGKFLLSDDKTRRCFVLELPYEDEDLSMLAVLPWDDQGLADVERQLTPEVMDFWEGDLEQERVRITLPRFRLDGEFGLSATLAAMGMPEPFTEGTANFEGITGDRSLHISEVVHKAFVEVNEEGSEAAAATAVRLGVRSIAGGRHYNLKFDHPFLFLIRDRRTKAILFMGRMFDPPAKSRIHRDEL